MSASPILRSATNLDSRFVNLAVEAVDRQVALGRGGHEALRFIAEDGAASSLTFDQLRAASNRFANALRALGVSPGERVCAFCSRRPELYVAALGAIKAGCVFSCVFAAYGPEPMFRRLETITPAIVLTTASLYAKRIAPERARLPAALRIVLADGADDDCLSYPAMIADASDVFDPHRTCGRDPALLFFTSGSTGAPKAAVHGHRAAQFQREIACSVLGLRPGTVFWCTADPGWVTGVIYGFLAPLLCGSIAVIDQGELEPERWRRLLAQERVEVWYTSPTALRMLMRLRMAPARGSEFTSLATIASVGEPLNPEVVRWCEATFGIPARDTWWQTETGAIMLATKAGDAVTAGAIGRPVAGVAAELVHRTADGVAPAAPGSVGEFALRAGWPSMFLGYWNDSARTAACFRQERYLSGDLMRLDDEGRYWFVGRADDVIKSAGHLIGPFEVESALLEHRAVGETGVAGRPDPLIGAAVVAVVTLKAGFTDSSELRRDILAFARRRLGAAAAPREILVRDALPKTPSGKILRRELLRAPPAEAAATAVETAGNQEAAS